MGKGDTKNLPANSVPTRKPAQYSRLKRSEVGKILTAHLKGYSYEDCAKLVDRDIRVIHEVIRDYSGVLDLVKNVNPEEYSAIKGQLLNAVEYRAVKAVMDEDAISRANLRDRVYMLKETQQVRRLEEGQSTSNTAVDIRYTKIDLSKQETDKD